MRLFLDKYEVVVSESELRVEFNAHKSNYLDFDEFLSNQDLIEI